MTNSSPQAPLDAIIHELQHYLPAQLALKDFIHHNSLHAYQHMCFFDAVFKASGVFGYQPTLQLTEFRAMHKNGRIKSEVIDRIIAQRHDSTSAPKWRESMLKGNFDESRKPRIGRLRSTWKQQYGFDLDGQVQPLLFRILSGYLDQGIAQNQFPASADGFLASVRALEKSSFTSFFKTKAAKHLLLDPNTTLETLLPQLVGNPEYFEQYLFDQQFSHVGWSGFVSAMEGTPGALHDKRPITLREVMTLEAILELDALNSQLGKNWKPISEIAPLPPLALFADVQKTDLQEVLTLWQLAFEWSYYDEVLSGLLATKTGIKPAQNRSFQAVFCIDERECSLRRHIENVDVNCETLGAPGFFGVEFFFEQEGGKFYEKLCPAPVTPAFLVKESGVGEWRKSELLYHKSANSALQGFVFTLGLGLVSAGHIIRNLFAPKMSPAISDAFAHMHPKSELLIENTNPEHRENGLQVGFSLAEMTTRVENQLRAIGLIRNFAPIVYMVAHGSSSANNPHHGAHDCGACSGRPGSVNARVFAHMANHASVRKNLAEKGIVIPESTVFVGGMHDTAADEVAFYDEPLQGAHKEMHARNFAAFEQALNLNAKERSRRFASISTTQPIEKIRKAIKDRSVSLFEPRPELGHGTNSLCIVGRRDLSKSLFLDRRAFLNSYDATTDSQGNLLAGVMRPIGLVCGGINLEYYFSRVDNIRLGAGTKLPHNVVGLFGVTNGSDGDLRPGLPLQMIEVHDPIRLMVLVEHEPEKVLKAITDSDAVYEWYKNEWVHIMAIHPETRDMFYFRNGQFEPYTPAALKVETMPDFHELVEKWPKMPTNQTVDATRENLPVYKR
jgi:uncharacterized protein